MPIHAFALLLAAGAYTPSPARHRTVVNPNIVVSASWLRQHISDPNVVILSVGGKAGKNSDLYDTGHIPGARELDMYSVATDDRDQLKMQMVSPDSLRAVLEALGVSNRTRVILYSKSDWVSQVARVFVTLDYLGLGDQTSVLDGGIDAWKAAGGALETSTPTFARGNLRRAPRTGNVVDGAWVHMHLTDPSIAIVDARDRPFFTGERLGHYAARTGHIPGAANLFFATLVDSTNHYKSPDEARALFTQSGVPLNKTIVAYCHIGQTASVAYVQARRLGLPVKLYDGSFEEWSRNKSYPIELGDPKGTPVVSASQVQHKR